MWKSLLAVACLGACTQAPTTEPTLVVSPDSIDAWFESEPLAASVRWPAEEDCSNNGWSCSSGPIVDFTVTAATCDGCQISDLSMGLVGNANNFTLVATTTDAIALSLTVESDGVVRELTANATGDREIGLHVDCEVVWTSSLGDSELQPQPCGETHTADQTVLLVPSITTLHGNPRFPFCPDDASYCGPAFPRKTSQIVVSGAAVAWTNFDSLQLTDATAAHPLTVTAPLADGTLVSTTLVTPPVAP